MLEQIEQNAQREYQGDTNIDCIGSGATVTVLAGSLCVKGNVGDNVTIICPGIKHTELNQATSAQINFLNALGLANPNDSVVGGAVTRIEKGNILVLGDVGQNCNISGGGKVIINGKTGAGTTIQSDTDIELPSANTTLRL